MSFATISTWMRLNFFSQERTAEPEGPAQSAQEMTRQRTGRTFPADEVVWGIAIRNGFDEIDDPWYHRGTTQHAYLEGHDSVALCGFRPPQSGPRTRRRSRLGLPTDGEHPMCGICARMVVAPRPRPRVPVPVQTARPTVAIPVSWDPRVGHPSPVAAGQHPIAANGAHAGNGYAAVGAQGGMPPVAGTSSSPWVRRASGAPEPPRPMHVSTDTGTGGLMARGVHADVKE